METLPCEASAFRFTWNKTEESHSYRRAYRAGTCRLRFSFFANDFDLRSRAVPQPDGCWRSARARHKPRRPVGLARLRLVLPTERGLRACSSVG
jgi:hypothetical protein